MQETENHERIRSKRLNLWGMTKRDMHYRNPLTEIGKEETCLTFFFPRQKGIYLFLKGFYDVKKDQGDDGIMNIESLSMGCSKFFILNTNPLCSGFPALH